MNKDSLKEDYFLSGSSASDVTAEATGPRAEAGRTREPLATTPVPMDGENYSLSSILIVLFRNREKI